jgi:Fe2+ or Zn2+ uptake regulation protein
MSRPSHVRDAVRERIGTAARHSWSVEEMLDDLRAGGVSADFSSVFRGLVWCETQGLVRRVDVGDGRTHYERSGAHHDHVRCERCGTIAEVPGCLIEGAGERLRSLTGYAVSDHRLVFLGLCPGCQR